MCRIFAYSGEVGSDDFKTAISEFAKLAQCGSVPQGVAPGHTDGWGVYASNGGKEVYVRSAGEATSEKLLTALAPLKGAGQALIHLRKATVGENKIANTHPFYKNGIALCHNGSIQQFPDDTQVAADGDTDSEVLFMRILSRIDAGPHVLDVMSRALQDETAVFRATNDWTSLTCLIQTREGIVLQFLWNESHPMTEVGKLSDYYTFFKGTKGGATILSSEKLDVPEFAWERIPNNTLLVVPLEQ